MSTTADSGTALIASLESFGIPAERFIAAALSVIPPSQIAEVLQGFIKIAGGGLIDYLRVSMLDLWHGGIRAVVASLLGWVVCRKRRVEA